MKFLALFSSALCFVISVYLFLVAFYAPGWEAVVFGSGVVMMSLAFFLPLHVFKTRNE